MALSAQDHVEMMQLVARYNHAADARDAEAWANTFSADGVFRKDGGPEIRGRSALAQMVRERPKDTTRHWTSNMIIEGDGDHATMLADFALLRGNRLESTGRYLNALTREAGHWKFARRELLTDPRPA